MNYNAAPIIIGVLLPDECHPDTAERTCEAELYRELDGSLSLVIRSSRERILGSVNVRCFDGLVEGAVRRPDGTILCSAPLPLPPGESKS